MDSKVWIHYAMRKKPAGAKVNYIIQKKGDPAPPDATLVGEKKGIVAYVRSKTQWERDKAPDFPRVAISPLYDSVLLRSMAFFRRFADKAQAKES